MRVLSVYHGRHPHSGLFGEAVRAGGHQLDERSFARGRLPGAPAESYDAVMVFGGGMNVHEVDSNPWIVDETRMLEGLLEAQVPVLGVCLGGQLLASAAGAQVSRARLPEIGWYEVRTTPEAAADPLLQHVPDRFTAFQWHSYQFALPSEAVLLAYSPVCAQAYRLGDSAWGIQFHAEVTKDIVSDWISREGTDPDAVRVGFDPARERLRLEEQIGRWNRLSRKLVGGFLAFAAGRVGIPAHA
jgi:GMP synthase (glutamine-hydrolysing)